MAFFHGKDQKEYYEKTCSRIALQDFLTRQFASQFEDFNFKAKGSGKSGLLSITRCGQEVLERSACEITDTKIISRFHVGFPATSAWLEIAGGDP